jgi:thioredoxin:protein disulfide reductase
MLRLRRYLAATLAVCALAGAVAPVPATADGAGLSDAMERARERADALRRGLSDADEGTAEGGLLPPDRAFKSDAVVRDGKSVTVELKPAKGYYLYRSRMKFEVVDTPGVSVAGVSLPHGEMKSDPTFGETEVFHEPVAAMVSLQHDGSAREVSLRATYQGCSDKKVCYPPVKKVFRLSLAGAPAAAPLSPPSPSMPGDASQDAGSAARLLAGHGFWTIVGGFVLFGLLLAFTPCVLPMVPILSGIIVGGGAAVNRRRGLLLSCSYVSGMAVTYAGAGVAAGLSGTMLSAALQNAWVLSAFAGLFVLLALSMFGFFDIALPHSVQSRFAAAAARFEGGGVAAAGVMGALSALIVSPCVAAPLAGALLYISQTRDVVLGGTALFALAIGMGLPLIAVGVSAGALLPRAGPWMNGVKTLFGFILLGVAVWIVSPVLPPPVGLGLWAAIAIGVAAHLAWSAGRAAGWPRLGGRLAAVVAFACGAVLAVGAATGSRDAFNPLAGLYGNKEAAVRFVRIADSGQLDERLKEARGRYVMLDFYADWCVSCKEMERETLSDPRVRAMLKDVVLLQADVTANTESDQALLRRFGLFGPPGIVFFDREGREAGGHRVVGFQTSDRFLSGLEHLMCC